MKQLEIQFFWPLTEQIPLDLDYRPCEEYSQLSILNGGTGAAPGYVLTYNSGLAWSNTVTSQAMKTSKFTLQVSNDTVGYWSNDDESLVVTRDKRPNWLHRYMTQLFFGMKWKDKE